MASDTIRITPSEREWLREASAILNGREASTLVRRKAASFVRLIADRDEQQRRMIKGRDYDR